MRGSLVAGFGIAVACGATSACGTAPTAPAVGRAVISAPIASTLPTPARYVITEARGAFWDPAFESSLAPKIEPAIIDGTRLLLDHGVVLSSRSGPEGLVGFASMPKRIGGGVVVWSEGSTYRADDLLADLRLVVDVGATGGARPWLSSILIRTERGLLTIDPRTLAVTREATPGLADAIAIDARRAVRLDLFGRAFATTDAARTFTDLGGSRGLTVGAIHEGDSGIVLQTESEAKLVWDGANEPAAPADAPPQKDGAAGVVATSASSRTLATESLAHAMIAGAAIPGGRIVVARERGLRVLGAAGGRVLDDQDLVGVGEAFARCQPTWIGDELLLACAHGYGAHLLTVATSLADPRLEATFSDVSVFVGGLGTRFGFAGRCGSDPPTPADFGLREGDGIGGAPGSRKITPTRADAGESDAVYFCSRVEPGRWVERTLTGEDARHLYRWVPGDDGIVTALVLDGPSAAQPVRSIEVRDGVRVIHLDPADPALGGAKYRAPLAPSDAAPLHAIDRDAWLDASGRFVRAWVALPQTDDPANQSVVLVQGDVTRELPLSRRAGGRMAGVEIAADGRVTVHPLPPEIVEVVVGGAFALARAENPLAGEYATDAVTQTLESTDGGATWTAVPSPPIGRVSVAGETASRGCSALGCTWGDGVVRLGWGAPRDPSHERAPDLGTPAVNARLARLAPLAVSCRAEPPLHAAARAKKSESSYAVMLRRGSDALGAIDGGAWSADVADPFHPAASLHHERVAAWHDPVFGDVAPILRADRDARVDLAVHGDHQWLALGRSSAAFSYDGALSAFVEAAKDKLVGFDAADGQIVLVERSAARPLFKLTRALEVGRTRFTLARRLDRDAVAVVGLSSSSGEIVAGDLDLGRAEVGSLSRLGALSMAIDAGSPACARANLTHRFVAEIPLSLSLTPSGASERAAETEVSALVLLEASADRLCVVGIEASIEADEQLSISMRPRLEAVVRGPRQSVRATCVVGR